MVTVATAIERMAEDDAEITAGREGWANAFTVTFADGIMLRPRDTGAATIEDLSKVTSILYETRDEEGQGPGEGSVHGEVRFRRIEEEGQGPGEGTVPGEVKLPFMIWRKMGEDMSKCTNLKRICLDGCTISIKEEIPYGSSSETLMALFGEDRAHKFPLEELELGNFMVRDRAGYYPRGYWNNAILKILPFIKSMPTLKCLDLSRNGLVCRGAVQIARATQDIPIEKLHLNGNSIADEGIEALLGGKNSDRFVEFHIHDQNRGYKRRGRDAIVNFLSQEDNDIESFGVDCKAYKYAKVLIQSLPKTTKLASLVGTIGSGHKNAIGAIAPCLQSLICDASSLETLCRSNCRLKRIGRHTEEYLRLRNCYHPHPNQNAGKALYIHQRSLGGSSDVRILRDKIRGIYFVGEFDVQPFLDMDVVLMPHVLGLVANKRLFIQPPPDTDRWGSIFDQWEEGSQECEIPSDDLNVVYRLVRSCHVPEMFNFLSPEAKISSVEAKNESLRGQNARLMLEAAELRSRLALSPSKRAKTTKS